MKFDTNNITLEHKQGKWYMQLLVPNRFVGKIKTLVDKDVHKSIEIKQKRKSRSLNANAYLWTIINKMAIVLGSTDEEIYIRLLNDFGTKEYVVAVPEARPILLKAYKIVEVVKAAKVNGKNGTLFRLIRGSSTYDTLEMSILIKGVVDEAKSLNIETLTPNEIKSMMDNYIV